MWDIISRSDDRTGKLYDINLIVSLFFPTTVFGSGNLLLIAPFADLCLLASCDVTAGVIIGNDTSDCYITLGPILQEQLQAIMGAFVAQYNTWTYSSGVITGDNKDICSTM